MDEEGSFTKRQDARTSLPQFEDERPLFHSNQTPPGPSESFLLSGSDVKVPYTINRYLRDYQREGIKFIYHNYAKSRGCLLGDDMGLGKTVQVNLHVTMYRLNLLRTAHFSLFLFSFRSLASWLQFCGKQVHGKTLKTISHSFCCHRSHQNKFRRYYECQI